MKAFILALLLTPLTAASHPGVGIVEDSKGNIFYTDLEKVWKIDTHGNLSIAVKSVHTHELFIDDNDNLFGEHLWYDTSKPNPWMHYVWKLSAAGILRKIIPDTPGFLENYSFVRDHFGRMYWADRSGDCQRVKRRNTNNSVTTLGDDCLTNIRFMHSNKHGEVFLMDFQDLKKIDNEGEVTTVASNIMDKSVSRSTIENQNSVMGIWDDPDGNIYTAIMSLRVIKKFGRDGKEQVVFSSASPWIPTGGLIDSKGNLWVLECTVKNEVRAEKVKMKAQ